jgi:hypothetical protein
VPADIWPAAKHIEGKSEIRGCQSRLALEPRQYKTEDTIIGNSEQQPGPLYAVLARYFLTHERSNVQDFIAEPLWRFP